PVVAAAVILDRANLAAFLHERLDDSKAMTALARERCYEALLAGARIGIVPDIALVDGNQAPALGCAVRTVVGGDALSFSIAAASVVAMVTRVRLMTMLARRYPGYGWERNAGYGTAAHSAALARLGITPHHRRSFAPVRLLSPVE